MDKSISEILKDASDRRKMTERAKILKDHDTDVLRGVLFVAFTPDVEFALPPGAPPYKMSENADKGAFYTHWRNLGTYLKNGTPGVSQLKRELDFIKFLEQVTPDDARLILSLKDHKMPYTGINEKVVNMAFPGLLPNG